MEKENFNYDKKQLAIYKENMEFMADMYSRVVGNKYKEKFLQGLCEGLGLTIIFWGVWLFMRWLLTIN